MGRIFDRAGPQTYGELCAASLHREAKVKLGRRDGAWALEVVASPTEEDLSWRAAAVLFADIAELDAQSWHLLHWLECARPDPEGQDERPIRTNEERR
jgi:hypothetical protein